MLIILLNQDKNKCAVYVHVGNDTESAYAYCCQCERLQGMH